MTPTLKYTIFYVADVPATVTFYEQAFGLKTRFMHDSQLYAELETGATALAFASESMADLNGLTIRPNRSDQVPAAVEIALVSADPSALYQRAIAAGAIALKPPETKPWGQLVGYVQDINGCLVEICSEVS